MRGGVEVKHASPPLTSATRASTFSIWCSNDRKSGASFSSISPWVCGGMITCRDSTAGDSTCARGRKPCISMFSPSARSIPMAFEGDDIINSNCTLACRRKAQTQHPSSVFEHAPSVGRGGGGQSCHEGRNRVVTGCRRWWVQPYRGLQMPKPQRALKRCEMSAQELAHPFHDAVDTGCNVQRHKPAGRPPRQHLHCSLPDVPEG